MTGHALPSVVLVKPGIPCVVAMCVPHLDQLPKPRIHLFQVLASPFEFGFERSPDVAPLCTMASIRCR
jgi:hypothetical protein